MTGRNAPNSAVGLEAMRYDRSEFDGLLTSFPHNGDLWRQLVSPSSGRNLANVG
jgi:hypothetical protein